MAVSVDRSTLLRLKQLPRLFRLQDAEKVAPHTAIFLARAHKKGLIHRLNRGNYINSFLHGFPQVEEVACFLRPPAYVSCEWALNYHGLILQSPVVCTAITLSSAVGKSRSVDYQGVTIEFSRISQSLFFGFQPVERFLIASGEKAIVDTLYLRGRLPVEDELDVERVDMDSLLKMASKLPRTLQASLARITGSTDIDITSRPRKRLRKVR
jgi:predicted transcriptional regulator of viral defense system